MTIRGRHKHIFSSWQYLALGYVIVILIGTFLLTLPIATSSGNWNSFVDSFFTATSATCVTGLVVQETSRYWTVFGQIVILILIQIGGIGFMTMISLISMFLRRKIGIYERRILMQSSGNMRLSGIVHLIRRILIGTLIVEGVGTALLSIAFCQDFGWTGLWYALFHSVSAFCNAGFDILIPGSSLSNYVGNPLVVLTVCALILTGGIGFIVWSDLIDSRFRFKRLLLHTRIILIATAVLIIVPTCLYLAFEHDRAFRDMNGGTMFLSALFAAVSPRTAGFSTVDPVQFSDAGNMLTMVLMFIGGCSGSTAGGVKVSTIVILLFTLIATIRNSQDINVGRRRVENVIIRQSATIVVFYAIMIAVATMALCAIDRLSLRDAAYEVTSAICTVGLSLDVTPTLSIASKLIVTLLMYSGRVGVLTIALAIGEKHKNPPINRPTEKVIVG